MALKNVRVLPYNYLDSVTCATQDVVYPTVNLLTDHRFDRFKTSAATQHIVSFDFNTASKRIRAIALNYSMLPDEEITVKLYKNNTTDLADRVYDGTAHPLMSQNYDAEWDDTELTNGYLLDDYDAAQEKLYINYDMDVVATNGTLTFDLNASSVLNCNYLYVGDIVETDRNIFKGYSSFYSHDVNEAMNSAGDSFFNDGAKFNNIVISWELLTEHERQRFKLFSKTIGKSKKIILSVNPELGTYAETLDQIWGTVQDDIDINIHQDYQENKYLASLHIRAPIG